MSIIQLASDPELCRGIARSMSPHLLSRFDRSVIKGLVRASVNELSPSIDKTIADRMVVSSLGHALMSLYFGDDSRAVTSVLSRGYDLHTRCVCGTITTKCSSCFQRKWPWQLEKTYVLHPDFPRWWETCGCGREYRYACNSCNIATRALGGIESPCTK